MELRRRGAYVEDIASEVGLSQRTVVAWLNAGGFPERGRPKRKKPSSVAPYADYLYRRWQERCISMAQLYREIKGVGYEGSYDAVADHMRCLRKGLVPPAGAPAGPAGGGGGRTEGTRHESQDIARLPMLEAKAPEAIEPEQLRYLEELRACGPELAAAQEMAGRFARLVREREEGGEGGDPRAVVQRAGRGPGEPAEDARAADVRQGELRPVEEASPRGCLTAETSTSRLSRGIHPAFTKSVTAGEFVRVGTY